jgi:hypothetical protein
MRQLDVGWQGPSVRDSTCLHRSLSVETAMQHNRQAVRLTLLCLVLVPLIGLADGCGRRDKPKLYPVKGVVKYNGKPMSGGGTVIFFPLKGGSGKESSGTIADNGTFELMTYTKGDGAPPGEYRVVVYQSTSKEPDGASDDGKKRAEAVEAVSKADQIPLIYSNAAKSPLRQKIEEKDNSIEIDLKPAGAKKQAGA